MVWLADTSDGYEARSGPLAGFVVVLDLDNTTFDYDAALAKHIKRVTGYDPLKKLGRPSSYNYVAAGWVRSRRGFEALHGAAVQAQMFATMKPYEGAVEAINDLYDAGAIIKIATSRHLLPRELRHVEEATTLAGLRRNGVPYDELHFTSARWTVPGDVYFDDQPRTLQTLASLGLPYVVADAPYNRECPGPRMRHWSQARSFVEEIAAARGQQAGFAP